MPEETLTRAEVLAVLRSLELARGTARATVTIGTRTVTYKSDSDIEQALVYFRQKLDGIDNVAAYGTPRSRFVRLASRKGV